MELSLCFSGGALRAAAQVGVLRFLEEREVTIRGVSGSSAGSIMALLTAAGWKSAQIEAFLHSIRKRDLFRLGGSPGIFSLDGIEANLREMLGGLGYGELEIPCFACVTDLDRAKTRYLNEGDPVANVVASSALTPIFGPRKIGESWYIDGGFSDNLPVQPLLSLDAPVLAINVNPLEGELPTNFRSLLMRSLMIMLNSNIRPSRELAHAYLEVRGVATMGLFDFDRIEEAVEAGYREMESAWTGLKRALLNN
jgi:NTE family protein